LEDQSFYVIGYSHIECPSPGPGFIYHFKEDGTLLSNTSPDDDIIYPIAADIFPNGDIALIGYNTIERRSNQYEPLYKENFLFSEITSFRDLELNGDNLVICGKSNNNNNCSLILVEANETGDYFYDYCHIEDDTIKQIEHQKWVINPDLDLYYLLSSNAVFVLAGNTTLSFLYLTTKVATVKSMRLIKQHLV